MLGQAESPLGYAGGSSVDIYGRGAGEQFMGVAYDR